MHLLEWLWGLHEKVHDAMGMYKRNSGPNVGVEMGLESVPGERLHPKENQRKVLYDPGCLLDQKDTRSCKTHKARLCYHLCVQKDTSPKHVPLHAPVTCSSVFLTPLSRVHSWPEDERSHNKTWLPGSIFPYMEKAPIELEYTLKNQSSGESEKGEITNSSMESMSTEESTQWALISNSPMPISCNGRT
ncbi:hypothetical protein MJT46_007248 [Ovis ammon polii x Ovis aries]|nr:hypothetical protein MJT46_007248 [Ovis ammon polii x Ovis aries]